HLSELRERFDQLQQQIENGEMLVGEGEAFSKEVRHHMMRLESVGLFKHAPAATTSQCPLCASVLTVPVPNASQLETELTKLGDDLAAVQRDAPRLQEHISKLIDAREAVRDQIRASQGQLEAVTEEQVEASRIRDDNARVARVMGRISLYLESTTLLG